jgi:REP element-mobilizing transposase RayT
MTQPRSHLAPPGAPGLFHCVQRCVRRAFLCGIDRYTGQSFEHRKRWVEERLALLAESFAISIHAYAVMSNHLHLVVELVPDAAVGWSDADVAARWVRLFPPRTSGSDAIAEKCARLLSNPERLQTIRRRLADLSWCMRCLAEPIVRRANREDNCKGRFWEGRFKAQRLCDERTLLAAMAYVDLNPVRAGVVKRLEASKHTSAAKRFANALTTPEAVMAPLAPILGLPRAPLALNTADYLTLLDWTGRRLAPGKRGRLAAGAPHILGIVGDTPDRWTTRVRGIGNGYWRAVGTAQDLITLAKRIGQQWLKGVRFAAKID